MRALIGSEVEFSCMGFLAAILILRRYKTMCPSGESIARDHGTFGPKGLLKDPYIQIIPIMENQMEKKMENEMETGVIKGLYRDPSIQIIFTLGPEVCKYRLYWAIWIPRSCSRNHGARRVGDQPVHGIYVFRCTRKILPVIISYIIVSEAAVIADDPYLS